MKHLVPVLFLTFTTSVIAGEHWYQNKDAYDEKSGSQHLIGEDTVSKKEAASRSAAEKKAMRRNYNKEVRSTTETNSYQNGYRDGFKDGYKE